MRNDIKQVQTTTTGLSRSLALTLALLCAITLPVSATAADRFADVEVTTQHVAGNVHVLFGAGGNIGVSRGSDGLLMVDDQYGPLADRIKAALGTLGDEPPVWLLNTHYHGDHTGGNPFFGTDSTIVAHSNVRSRLLAGDPPMADAGLPVLTYTSAVSIWFNGEEVQLVHAPKGHTDGDTIVWFTESNVVHMGDHYFRDRFPYVDLGAGGSVAGVISAVEQVLARIGNETRIIPGHGPIADRTDLERYLDMLKTTRSIVSDGLANGLDADALVENGLGDAWESWGSGFISEERWIRTLAEGR